MDTVKIYLATSWKNDAQPVMVELLRTAGFEVYDFRHPHIGPGKGGEGFHWSWIDPYYEGWGAAEFRGALKHQFAIDGFSSDLAGMEWADVGVMLLPCGRSAHLEAGWMAGQGKPVYGVLTDFGPDDPPELMYGLLTGLCVDDSELLRVLRAAKDLRIPAR